MAVSVCPTCNSPIDPARAPVARVVGTRIMTFCSSRCAEQAAAGGVRATTAAEAGDPADVPASEPQGNAVDSALAAERARDYMPLRPRSSRKGKIIALSATIMAGGMAITIINAVSPSTPSNVSAGRASVTAGQGASSGQAGAGAPAPEAPVMAVPLSPADHYARAAAVLRELMASPSLRIRRIAAMALSRTGDRQALEYLNQALEEEGLELTKVDIAYALARAGDNSAQKLLRRRLKHSHRDVRVDAARALVQLGDDSGADVLKGVLSLHSHRLGAAGLLARLGDEEGMEALRKELAGDGGTEESRMRAVVALGRAGDASMRDQLVAMLQDHRYHVGAADALAFLGERAAEPALVKQLTLPSLCVRAAIGLRRLDAHVELDVLVQALEGGSDPARVSAAEAMLILTGPRELAERD